MIKRIKEYFEKRRNLRTMKEYTMLYQYTILKTVNDIIEGKEGLIELFKSFDGMPAEEIQDKFFTELAKMIHADAKVEE